MDTGLVPRLGYSHPQCARSVESCRMAVFYLLVVSLLSAIFILKQTWAHSRLAFSLAELLGRVGLHLHLCRWLLVTACEMGRTY